MALMAPDESAFDYDMDDDSIDTEEETVEVTPENKVTDDGDYDGKTLMAQATQDEDHFDYDDDEDDEDIEDNEEISDGDDDSADGKSGADDDSGKAEEVTTELLFEAAKAGLDYERVSKIKDPEALKMLIEMASNGKQSDNQELEKSRADEDDEFKFEPIDIGDELDEDVADVLKPLLDKINPQMEKLSKDNFELKKALKQKEVEAQEQVETVARTEFFRWFDETVTGMQEWSDIFGKGNIDSLDEGSEASVNRIKLVKEMDAQTQAHPELAQDRKKLLDIALQVAFPQEKQEKTARQKQQKTRDHLESRATQRPAGKEMSAISKSGNTKRKAKQTALAAIRSFWKK